MDFLSQLLRGIAFVPALVNGIEGLFGDKPGAEKKDAAMSFLQNALAMTDAVAAREIIDPDKFQERASLKSLMEQSSALMPPPGASSHPPQSSQPTA